MAVKPMESQAIWDATALFCGAPEVIRTPDLLVRSQTLYPAELRARVFNNLASIPDPFDRLAHGTI